MGVGGPLTFLRQSIRDFRTTGSLAPSSVFLARAVARSVPHNIPVDFRILEVGPGTGSITVEIVKRMNGRGHLDLWEISPLFCQVLREKVRSEPVLNKMAARIKVHEGDVRTLKPEHRYDLLISGLPFNCFEPAEVKGFLEHFRALLKPQGVLAWFEYVAIRKIQSPFVGKSRRAQLRGVRDVTRSFVHAHQFKQEIIPVNLPPARVRQLKFGE